MQLGFNESVFFLTVYYPDRWRSLTIFSWDGLQKNRPFWSNPRLWSMIQYLRSTQGEKTYKDTLKITMPSGSSKINSHRNWTELSPLFYALYKFTLLLLLLLLSCKDQKQRKRFNRQNKKIDRKTGRDKYGWETQNVQADQNNVFPKIYSSLMSRMMFFRHKKPSPLHLTFLSPVESF